MSNPTPKIELHEAVHGYIKKIGGTQDEIQNLHYEIEHPEARTECFDEFMAYIEE